MSNSITPQEQSIFINSSQGHIFDFNTPSSRVYLGKAVNSLLRVFGNNVIINGFRVLNYEYSVDNIITVEISSGECILDYTLIKYPNSVTLSIDVSGFENGVIIPNIFYNYSEIQQKNQSSIQLSHAVKLIDNINPNDYPPISEYHVPTSHWYSEYCILILALLEFNKDEKSLFKRQIPILQREKIKLYDDIYTVYPFDNISNRILYYLNDTFN